MQQIILSQGKFALIDNEDYELVSKYKWCASKKRNTFYALRAIKLPTGRYSTIHMHTFITEWSRVDHINGNGLDNQRSNLRQLNNSLNIRNQHVNWGSSKYKGVSWYNREGKWIAKINGIHVRKYVGSFHDEIEAAKAYDEAIYKIFGDITMLNFPLEGI